MFGVIIHPPYLKASLDVLFNALTNVQLQSLRPAAATRLALTLHQRHTACHGNSQPPYARTLSGCRAFSAGVSGKSIPGQQSVAERWRTPSTGCGRSTWQPDNDVKGKMFPEMEDVNVAVTYVSEHLFYKSDDVTQRWSSVWKSVTGNTHCKCSCSSTRPTCSAAPPLNHISAVQPPEKRRAETKRFI